MLLLSWDDQVGAFKQTHFVTELSNEDNKEGIIFNFTIKSGKNRENPIS